jgi:hypothetical protein
MSAAQAQVLEQLDRLPFEEQREVFEQLRDKFDDKLTPEQIAELDRRAERALAHPERCRPLDDVVTDIEKRFRARR